VNARRQDGDGAADVHIRRDIQAGDSGIWASCALGKEARCVGELKLLFEEVSSNMQNKRLGCFCNTVDTDWLAFH